MSLWGNVDNANNQPKYVTGANASLLLGISVTEAHANSGVTHPGWVQVKKGTGPVVSIAIGAAGTGYANGDAVVAANTNGDGFAGTVTTNGSGAITGVTITAGGQYTTAPTLTITTSGGANGALTATTAGRSGRVQQETLVAMGSIA